MWKEDIEMEVSYKRELDHNYLICSKERFQDSYQVGMLLHNQIPGLLECRMNMLDEKVDFYYDITSKQNLRLVLEKKRITGEELLGLLEGLQRAAQVCREYLLDADRILLNPDYIYLDPDIWDLSFCYVPFCSQDLQEELLNLAEYLLERLERQDQKAVTLGYEFYRMAGEANASLEQVLNHWRKEEKQQQGKQEDVSKEYAPTALPEVPRSVQTMGTETVCLKKEEEGLVLRSESAQGCDFKIKGESFLIGKKKDAVDGLIKNRGISRIHARISKEGENYYVTDLNSTNGTFLNGGRLDIHEKARIRAGDRVGFADVNYRVDL